MAPISPLTSPTFFSVFTSIVYGLPARDTETWTFSRLLLSLHVQGKFGEEPYKLPVLLEGDFFFPNTISLWGKQFCHQSRFELSSVALGVISCLPARILSNKQTHTHLGSYFAAMACSKSVPSATASANKSWESIYLSRKWAVERLLISFQTALYSSELGLDRLAGQYGNVLSYLVVGWLFLWRNDLQLQYILELGDRAKRFLTDFCNAPKIMHWWTRAVGLISSILKILSKSRFFKINFSYYSKST